MLTYVVLSLIQSVPQHHNLKDGILHGYCVGMDPAGPEGAESCVSAPVRGCDLGCPDTGPPVGLCRNLEVRRAPVIRGEEGVCSAGLAVCMGSAL